MAIDYSLLLTLKSMFRDGKYGREHNKHDFDADYNNFVLMQDKLIILANYEQAHGGIDTLLSYLDDNVVGSAINDEYWGVRAEIANQGYGLDKLIHDEEPKVRLLAYDALRAEEEQ